MPFVIVPGIDGSDHNHWQSRWEADWLPDATRIEPSSWSAPLFPDWTQALTTAVDQAGADVILIAHSLGCLTAAQWLAGRPGSAVRGAFLVAPPDELASTFPHELLQTFTGSAPSPLGVPAVLVVSDNDPYCTVDAAARLAAGWAVPLITAGELGHVNSDSNLGLWPQGQNLLTAFLAGLGCNAFAPS